MIIEIKELPDGAVVEHILVDIKFGAKSVVTNVATVPQTTVPARVGVDIPEEMKNLEF